MTAKRMFSYIIPTRNRTDELLTTLRQMPRDEIVELAEEDGAITADCQFCGRLYRFPVDEI